MLKKGMLICLTIFLILQAGCWSKVEIDDLAIVSAIGVDRIKVDEKEKWRVTIEIYRPLTMVPFGEGGGGGQSSTGVVSSVAETIQEAINNFNSRSPRILFFAHTQFIVIGKKTAEKESLTDILPYFLGTKEIRLRNKFFISDKSAFEMLTSGWELEQDLADEIEGLAEKTRRRLSKSKVSDLREVGSALLGLGRDVITGRLEVFPTPESPLKEEQGGQVGQGGQSGEKHSIRLNGSAVFSGDRMVGWFSELESRGYLFAKGEVEKTVIPINFDGDDVFDASVRIIKSSGKTKINIRNGLPEINIKIKAEGQIEELCAGEYKVDSDFLDELGKKTSQEVEKEVFMAIEKAKLYRADIFGFGESIYRKHPNYWRQIENDWRDYFVSLPVTVEVETYIRRTGALNQPLRSL